MQNSRGIFTVGNDSSWLNDLSKEPIEIDLKLDIIRYHRQICEVFDQIEEIQITAVESRYCPRVRFDVKTKNSSVEDVLEKESKFRMEIRDLLPIESRMNFVLVVHLLK